MNSMFHDFIGKFMQIYIDAIVVKSSSEEDHLEHLRLSFERMRKHGLKMNPLKCAFGVRAGDFFGFVVHKKGIEINENKTKAILETKPPSAKKELQSLLGKLNLLRRFISNRAGNESNRVELRFSSARLVKNELGSKLDLIMSRTFFFGSNSTRLKLVNSSVRLDSSN